MDGWVHLDYNISSAPFVKNVEKTKMSSYFQTVLGLVDLPKFTLDYNTYELQMKVYCILKTSYYHYYKIGGVILRMLQAQYCV